MEGNGNKRKMEIKSEGNGGRIASHQGTFATSKGARFDKIKESNCWHKRSNISPKRVDLRRIVFSNLKIIASSLVKCSFLEL